MFEILRFASPHLQLSVQFTAGAALVIGSIFMYGYQPQQPAKKASKDSQQV